MKFVAWLIVLATVSCIAHADDRSALWNFARRHEGRFITELPVPPPTFKLRFASDASHFVLAKYLPREGVFVDTAPPTIQWQILELSCKPAGTYVGRTATGATATVSRRNCQQLVIEDPGGGVEMGREVCLSYDPTAAEIQAVETADCGVRRRAMWANMTADQFRALRAKGAEFEVTFDVGRNVEDQVVSREVTRHAPKLSSPYEMLIDGYTVRGKITSVRLTLPGGHVEEVRAER